MKYLVGIDNGGTFSKAAIFDEEGNQISVASVPTETLTPKPGYTEKDLNELWRVNAQAVRQAVEKVELILRILQVFLFRRRKRALYGRL